jgi:rhamnose utilization protein RhaD (predicted bifunctional aldolase and dehydrogenase)/NAD(P)-dependent dehydrogenase (short-subunit alcohol dehydrogenase family)
MTQSKSFSIDTLIEISREYGSDPTFVLAGGGNTSAKTSDRLYVKASGHALATINPDGFVVLDREKLGRLAEADLGDDPEQREAEYKTAIYDARLEPDKGQRPSVECLLHHLLPDTYVVHTHATIANALTCHTEGEVLAQELFSDEVLWLPYVDPGFTIARSLKAALEDYQAKTGRASPKALLMANHGLIVSGDDAPQIRSNTAEVLGRIADRLGDDWKSHALGPASRSTDQPRLVNIVGPALRGILSESDNLKIMAFDDSDVALGVVGSDNGKSAATGGPLCPDQIVYCNSYPLWFEPEDGEDEDTMIERLRQAVADHTEQTGFLPKVVLVRGIGLFAAGDDYKAAATTRDVYLDAVAVMAGATRLGGISYLTDARRRFIEDWEVEAYRKQIAAGTAAQGRVAGKVAVVTGAAQGFGLEIAQSLAAEGAYVVLSDLNEAGACEAAERLCATHGKGRAIGLAIDVTNVESVARCLHAVVRTYGGFDIFVSNAGVLKAESVKTQPLRDFQFVAAVNYQGYFVCTQNAAPILAVQHKAKVDYRSDIIQINSKSGLVGSNRNGAYAGSKFGGIGLTQSFALELVDDGIKVNSVCPGNFFDGPLWSDPENGLFMQYLRTDKVSGAKTIDDVRKAYEAKVPMGRGCTTEDVMQAVFYLIDQQYETGQAVPVTGGQVMLS